jgi:hypothetical protein
LTESDNNVIRQRDDLQRFSFSSNQHF